MNHLTEMAKRVNDVKNELADTITDRQSAKYPDKLGPISDVLRAERIKMISLYEELIMDDLDTALSRITQWGNATGALCSELGMTIDIALDELDYYREKFSDIIYEICEQEGCDLKSYHSYTKKLNMIIDQAAQSFSVAFVKQQKEFLNRAKEEIAELSVPVVPLEKKVAVLPLIGSIDTYRAKLLMEESLRKSAKQGISYFILDVSGVPIVDTMVASQLFQVINALKLLGVEAVITGIRPEIAQTMVSLGINFSTVKTYSSVKQAMAAYRKNNERQ
ncbi:STAS domain-containing protein [Mesobacillus subterraneus]|nr:STAS domain-containing protein [Mesobacillus subterraneus]